MDNNRCTDSQNNDVPCNEAEQARGALSQESMAAMHQGANQRRTADIAPPAGAEGFHVPFPITVAVENDSRLRLGLNILGLVKGGVTLGDQTGVYAGSDILRTDVRAGVDLNKDHIGPATEWRVLDGALTAGSAKVGITPGTEQIRLGGGADVKALGGIIDTGAHAGVDLGQHTGPQVDAHAGVGPAGVSADTRVQLSQDGLGAGVKAGVGIDQAVGLEAQVKGGLGTNNELHTDLRGTLGQGNLDAGVGLYPQVRPDAYVRTQTPEGESGAAVNPLRTWNEPTTRSIGQSTRLVPDVPVDAGRPDVPARADIPAREAEVEVRPLAKPEKIEARELPPIDNQPRGADGLTMDERAAKYKADRAEAATQASLDLSDMFSNGGVSNKDRLAAAYKAANDTGLDKFHFTTADGKQMTAQIEVVNYGIRDAVHIFAIDSAGHKHVMLRGVQNYEGDMVQQNGKDGKPVSFESKWWSQHQN